MDYTANSLKKQYEKDCSKQRIKNLVKLREEIAKMTQTQFSAKIGIQKTNLNSLEKGDRDMSLFNIQAYKKYFLDNYNINLSVDFLMGYTDIMENNGIKFQEKTGLSNDAISMLMEWKQAREKQNSIIPAFGSDTDTLNLLLEYQYWLTQKVKPNYPAWSVFHYIGQYLTPYKMKREQQDLVRICNGNSWINVEHGDILFKKDGTSHTIINTKAINSETFSGNNTSEVNVVNDANDERYVLDVDNIFKSFSKDQIFKVLDKTKSYLADKIENKKKKH